MAKKIEEIIKELEEQYEETKDDVSKFSDKVADAENGFKEFGEKMKTYTYDNFNEASPWLALGGAAAPGVALPITAAALGVSSLAAGFDYASDRLDQLYKIPELVQDIYDYVAAYNEKVKAAEGSFNEVDNMANRLKEYWDKIKNLVDENNGKLEDTANEDEFLKIIDDLNKKVPDANIVLEGNQIKNYDEVDKLIYNKIDKASISEKRSYLKESYDEALLNKDIIAEKYQNSLYKRNHAYGDWQKALTRYDMAIANLNKSVTFGPSDDLFNLQAEIKAAEKKFEKANLEFDAISRLYTSYKEVNDINENLSNEESELDKAIAQAEYEVNYPDAGKTLQQLEGEAYAKKEIERHNTNSTSSPTPPFQANVTIPTLYTNDHPPVNDIPNQVYNPEIAEPVNSLNDAVIIQAAALPEAMREIGQQSIAAFTEGLLDGDDEHLGERVAEATLKILNMFSDNIGDAFYQSGGESAFRFMEGFGDKLDSIYDSVMAERSLAVEGMTAGQQMASFNFYGSAPQQSSGKPETIVLKNHEDIRLLVDGDVLAKTVREAERKFQRGTGT